ncbi:hypothetical protein [Rubripirellula tenax]|uniref:hypothetical protein n=1 Tax=Rubripirellula tenax TaxID=2528015 RepID=UPI0011B46A8A|nr:hypothetical protein [Rubripirellula tenax]
MFIRFVACDPNREPGRPEGVFGAAYDILEHETGPKYLHDELRSTLDWFVTNLPIPDRFALSRRPHRSDDGICWFKMESVDCVARVRYLAYLVAECGIPVRQLTTATPGYVIYEDDFQLVAAPFATTPR